MYVLLLARGRKGAQEQGGRDVKASTVHPMHGIAYRTIRIIQFYAATPHQVSVHSSESAGAESVVYKQ